jgi:hypothetical protein
MRAIVDAHAAGDRERAVALYQQWLPLINYENRQTGLLAAKALMRAGGVIACEAPRHPFPAMHPDTRAGLIDMARRLVPESRSTTIGIAATAQRQTVLSTDALGALLFVCRRFDALKAEHLDLQKELHGMTSTLPFTALKEGGEARRDRLRRGRTLGSSLLAVAGSYDKMVEPLGNLVQRDHLLAALISSSTHSKQGETGAPNAFCTKGLWPILFEKHPLVREDVEKALKPPTTGARSLLLASRMAASGASHRVVGALRIFMFGCPGLTATGKAKHAALDSICGTAFEIGDIMPATSNLTPEQQEQQAQDAAATAEGATTDEAHMDEIHDLNWEARQGEGESWCGWAGALEEHGRAGTG